ncbi:MAG: hypothetical protein E7437_09710 [Ruminococcaceae bacterium]|nr:hypothetical protein [Oscillospiraceae bacterium]
MQSKLDVIIPIAIELDWPTKETILECIRTEYRRSGFTRYALSGPCGGWRSKGYPPTEHFVKLAELSRDIIQELAPEGIECGWWITLTVKSGSDESFTNMVKSDGSEAPFSACPLDPTYRNRFAQDIALFARIAKPAFIITEDDYSMVASAGKFGCFCHHHLEEFSRREGVAYSREALVRILKQTDPEALALRRRWQETQKDALVELAKAIRQAVDVDSPEIPIGCMQAGSSDMEGFCTEAICRAMAGPRHIPFSRLCGVQYCGIHSKNIPAFLYHPLYTKEHTPQPFRYYHETDTYPHTRFYSSAAQMRTVFAAVYSYGFHGSTFQTQQLLDDPTEEPVYALMFARERDRLNALHNLVMDCQLRGVQICYDPFYNPIDSGEATPLWVRSVSHFGIPYTSTDAPIAFWDVRQAKYADHDSIMDRLARGLFLDGSAAKELVARGYGEYLGVSLGEDVAEGRYGFDLGAREVIEPEFRTPGKGQNMPSSHMYAVGKNGKLFKMTVTDPHCQVVTRAVDFQMNEICPAMTRFENKLGGKVVVMGTSLENNLSHNLFNYRRQRLIQQLTVWCNDCVAFVKDAACVYTIMNEAVDPEKSGFIGLLTLSNLSEDPQEGISIHLPEQWKHATRFQFLDQQGMLQPLPCKKTQDGICIDTALGCLEQLYIVIGA